MTILLQAVSILFIVSFKQQTNKRIKQNKNKTKQNKKQINIFVIFINVGYILSVGNLFKKISFQVNSPLRMVKLYNEDFFFCLRELHIAFFAAVVFHHISEGITNYTNSI